MLLRNFAVLVTLAGLSASAIWADEIAVLEKLEAFERKKRSETEAAILSKREEVLKYLNSQLLNSDPDSPEAGRISAVIATLKNLEPDDVFEVAKIQLAKPELPEGTVDDLFQNLSARLSIEAAGWSQAAPLGDKSLLIKLDGQELFTGFRATGAFVVSLSREGVASNQFFDHVWKDSEQVARAREGILEYIASIPEDRVIIFAICGAYDPLLRVPKEFEALTKSLGGRADRVTGASYILVGYKGLRRGKAIEEMGGVNLGDHATINHKK